jgi:hypothetical protein
MTRRPFVRGDEFCTYRPSPRRRLIGDRDDEWPEFVFVTAAHGTGWVPIKSLAGGA